MCVRVGYCYSEPTPTPPTGSSLRHPPAKLRGMQMVRHVEVEALHFNQTKSTAPLPFVWAERCPCGQVECNLYASLVRNANA